MPTCPQMDTRAAVLLWGEYEVERGCRVMGNAEEAFRALAPPSARRASWPSGRQHLLAMCTPSGFSSSAPGQLRQRVQHTSPNARHDHQPAVAPAFVHLHTNLVRSACGVCGRIAPERGRLLY
mmetsp:Transcript_33467/g.106703  ORF Transcript_33467/g.106703 Transcript_33467/m.106703 type:complete len:123 (+) Transcript_33467:199-567(+)|eukprot:scaffold6711_cov118-Isochrysis_galbana.AAC.39